MGRGRNWEGIDHSLSCAAVLREIRHVNIHYTMPGHTCGPNAVMQGSKSPSCGTDEGEIRVHGACSIK